LESCFDLGKGKDQQTRRSVGLADARAAGLAACSGDASSDRKSSTLGVPDCNSTDNVDDPSALNGVYQLEWSLEDLVEASGLPEDDVEGDAGLFNLLFSDGCFNHVLGSGIACAGAYTVTGNRVSLVATLLRDDWDCADQLLGNEFLDAAWELNDNQLMLSDFVPMEQLDDLDDDYIAVFFGTKPLRRVGEADGTIG
jgi:hypothetical protein